MKHGIRKDGGTCFSLTPSGESIAVGSRDLYDAAFVAFGLASAAKALGRACLLYTTDAADEQRGWDPGGPRYD